MSIPQGHRYVLIAMDPAIGVGIACLIPSADHSHTIKVFQWFTAMYGKLLGIVSDQGTHFIGVQVKQWAKDNDITGYNI